jgi:DNA-binding transcriptional regulator YdaS (Cro superfamily)
VATVRSETLRRASEIIGDDKKLADTLGINPDQLREWKSSEKPIPEEVFLKCADIVVSDTIRCQQPPERDNSH